MAAYPPSPLSGAERGQRREGLRPSPPMGTPPQRFLLEGTAAAGDRGLFYPPAAFLSGPARTAPQFPLYALTPCSMRSSQRSLRIVAV